MANGVGLEETASVDEVAEKLSAKGDLAPESEGPYFAKDITGTGHSADAFEDVSMGMDIDDMDMPDMDTGLGTDGDPFGDIPSELNEAGPVDATDYGMESFEDSPEFSMNSMDADSSKWLMM